MEQSLGRTLPKYLLNPPGVDRLAFRFERLELGPDARLAFHSARAECRRHGPSCQFVR